MCRSRSRAFCFTLNNPNAGDRLLLLSFAQTCVYYVAGNEHSPTTNTPHLQGYFYLKNGKTIAAVKKMPAFARAHVEAARGTPKEASDYCKKDGDFVEHGELPSQGKRTDLESFVSRVEEAPLSRRELIKEFPAILAKYPAFVDLVTDEFAARPVAPDILLKDWQIELFARMKVEANWRTIEFVVDLQGGGGKTTFADYCEALLPDRVQVLKPGRSQDNAYSLDISKRVFIMDVPRCRMEHLNYYFLEEIKDGRVHSGKYMSRDKRLPRGCHVMVFCNEFPDMTKLSVDRYLITQI